MPAGTSPSSRARSAAAHAGRADQANLGRHDFQQRLIAKACSTDGEAGAATAAVIRPEGLNQMADAGALE